MCGILGLVNFESSINNTLFESALDSLSHRGPDNKGILHLNIHKASIALGHRRLSILDLSTAGNQPFTSTDSRFTIVHNGEVYNFREIREDLLKKGYSFRSDTDTEVILYAYQEWGTECVHHFLGMFSFAILDAKEQTLILFRDRFGVKPLYILQEKNSFIFASELKAIKPFMSNMTLSKQAAYYVMKCGYIPAPLSVFESVKKVKPGHFIELNLKTRKYKSTCYWNLKSFYEKPKKQISIADSIKDIKRLLINTISLRLVSDVPVGIFLSGGLDSSIVTAIIAKELGKKVQTFTIGFDEKEQDESGFAKDIASYLGTNHLEKICTEKDALQILEKQYEFFDEPFGDSSSLPTMIISQFSRQHVKVSLSADGGDELFAGYTRYFSSSTFFNLLQKNKCLAWAAYAGLKTLRYLSYTTIDHKLARVEHILHSHKTGRSASKIRPAHMSDFSLKRLLKNFKNKDDTTYFSQSFNTISGKNQMLALDSLTYLPDDILVKVDRASMSTSLESREPFLDHRLLEYLAQLPFGHKAHQNLQKYLLKEIAYTYIPKHLLDRPKKGFSVPLVKWLLGPLKLQVEALLTEEICKAHNIFNFNEVSRIKSQFYRKPNLNNATQLWHIYNYNLWFTKWSR
jgi:asparagine synthase (glutamine-hydrolysing)